MIYSIIPLSLILMSMGVIAVIVVRKFPQLSVLDVENIPQVKEEKKKTEILKRRVETRAVESKKIWAIRWKPVLAELKGWQLAFRKYVGRVERRIRHAATSVPGVKKAAPPISTPADADQARILLGDASAALGRGDLEGAEKKYIGVIRLDAKNKEAYRGLGDVYVKQGHANEAKETYAFLTQLDPADDAVLLKLSALAEDEGNLEDAVDYLQRAVLLNDNVSNRFAKLAELLSALGQYPTALEAAIQAADLEPQNPKYLDLLAELAILSGDKEVAREAAASLRMVNPENHRLAVLKDTIEKMPP